MVLGLCLAVAASAPAAALQPVSVVPQAAQAGQPAVQNPQAAQPRFTGNPVTLDFQGADLRAVLRTFSEISGLNLVIDPSIQGTVDVALRDVPWDQALDIILRANKLGYSVDGTIVRIAPMTVLAEEETQRRKLAEEQALAGELKVLTRTLSYAKAENLTKLLTATALSQRGTIQTDPRTNTIIINDLADRLERANSLLDTLDRPEPSVEIEARIVQTTREYARRLGVQWGFNAQASQALGNTLPLSFPNQVSVGGRTGLAQGPTGGDQVSNTVNLGIGGAPSAVGVALGSINGAFNLDVALTALERTGQGRILSTPKVSTQNNIEAEITQGLQIPIQTVANNTVTVSFRDAALTLRVQPQITSANTVIMRITMENSAPDFSRAINGIPPIDTQRALTQVLVSSGETTVIGGIYVSREQSSQDKTPALNRLPLLGWLFKRNELTDESRELLIFITPKILRL
jgi:type IV pilus assembly protein PilQ